jgi:uncharacterized protein (DUF1501 family)
MITRRDFMHSSFAAVGVGAIAPSWLARAAETQAAKPAADAAAHPDGKILVVVQMSGGNDGLNTVVPYADDLYHKARPNLRIEAKDVLKLDDHVGLHPSMKQLHARFDKGEVAVVQGVGYPDPDRSHFRSMAIWHAGQLNETATRTGWLGRAADGIDAGETVPSLIVHLGTSVPLALRRARSPILACDHENSFALQPDPKFPNDKAAQTAAFRKLCESAADPKSATRAYADILRATTASGLASADEMVACLNKTKNEVGYPNGFAKRLALIARMISGGMKTRVYYVAQGSYDTHARQKDTHARLLGELSESIDLFFQDLTKSGRAQDVAVITFSEFGRRVAENASIGTDHGTAGPMFVVGPSVKGGVVGAPPDLEHLVDQDPKFGIDFRSVYATVLADWIKAPPALGAPPAPLAPLAPPAPSAGSELPHLPLFNAA